MALLGTTAAFAQILADNTPITASSAVFDTTKMAAHAELLTEKNADAIGEEGTGRKRKANRLYKQLGYQASADVFKKMEEKGELDMAMMQRLAKSYRLNGNTESAEYWYSKVVNQNPEPSTMFYFAQALQSNGKCEDAVRWYKKFNDQVKRKDQVNLDFIEDCSEMKNFRTNDMVQVNNMSTLNSQFIDFCAVPYKQGVVFTSTRGLNGVSKSTDKWTEESFSDLFYAKKMEDGSYGEPVSMANDLNGRYHDGVATFTAGQNVMYFSRNNRDGKSKNGMRDLKVYSTKINNSNDWSKVEELPFNSDEFGTCHPTVTQDGKTMYFASDRPGGFGGMDIYVSQMVGGKWTMPKNLGPTVNTVGNEIFPSVNGENVLCFASNGHRGMGGLDIFAVQLASKSDMTSWTNRVNVGAPFNTPKDDFGFSINETQTKGFLSSSRDGGRGGDDIYEWESTEAINLFDKEMTKKEEVVAATTPAGTAGVNQRFVVVDRDSKQRLEKSIVTFEVMGDNDNPVYFTSDREGLLSHVLPSGKKVNVIVEKEGFETYTERITTADLIRMGDKDYTFELERRACTEMMGVVMNNDCNKPLADATVRVFNKCTGAEETFTTNRDGKFDSCLKCGCEYEIIGTKTNFTEDRTKLNTVKANCDSAQPMNVNLNVSSISPAPKTYPTTTTNSGLAVNDLRVGSLITLENIYYDYNKFTIRADASTDLEKVVKLMSEYPTMEIELGSHTDARGSDTYNMNLSQNRAQAAVNYLIKRGVQAHRIVAVGYGESRLTNHCVNGANCSDTEHQQNRRTEIKITKMN